MGGWHVVGWFIGIWNRNKRMSPGSLCLISIRPAMNEVQPCLPKKGQGPEILCHWFNPCQSLVQFILCPHPGSLASVPTCPLAGAACQYSGLHLEPPTLGASAWDLAYATRPARLLWGENKRMCKRTGQQTHVTRPMCDTRPEGLLCALILLSQAWEGPGALSN